LADDEFQELLEHVQDKIPPPQSTFSLNAHNQVIVVMAAGGMKKKGKPQVSNRSFYKRTILIGNLSFIPHR